MKYRYILLDIDGTLINFYESYYAAGRKVLEYADCQPNQHNLDIYLKCNDDAWAQLDVDNVDNPYILRNYHSLYRQYITDAAESSRNLLSLTATTSDLANRYIYEWGRCAVPNQNALSICQKLSTNHCLCIASNGLTNLQLSKLTEFKSYISHYFISEDINHIKPEKEYYEHILKVLNCQSQECIMVGDSLKNDIEGAGNCGISTCYYNPSGLINTTGITPDYEIRDFMELLEIVEK